MDNVIGGKLVADALVERGVDYIYSLSGGHITPIYQHLENTPITLFDVRHEQAAVHAADGYSRSSDKVGVALVTSGPGATNAVTGIATAYMDSIPMVIISGQVASTMVGTDAFQETDMIGISRPIVKHSFMIKHPSEIPEVMKKAFYLAQSGRPGPVVVDIPKDMTNPAEKFEYVFPKKAKLRSYSPAVRGHSGQIRKAAELLLAAKRPILYSGGGVINSGTEASHLLRELVDLTGFPITSTLMGLGAYPASGKNWLFFGNPHFTQDFLYQVEWQRYVKSGLLSKISLAFSRDQANKIYVQDRLREAGLELYQWLEAGAHFYVCGDANHMAKDVQEALLEVIAEHGHKSREEAEEYLSELRRAKRYQRDVY